MPAAALAYSYIRFSTQEQSKGDSLRRQIQQRDAWLNKHPHVRLDKRATFRDEGKSGRGQHLYGAMGVFLHKVEAGEIAKGSFLIVENLDRLGRLPLLQQLKIFVDLISGGITIVSTMDSAEYSAESLNGPYGTGQLLSSIAVMKRAYEESETKSIRSNAAWTAKRSGKGKAIPTKRVPAWIDVQEGKYKLIPERAAIVRQIFQLTLKGWGKERISKLLDDEGVECWGVGRQKGRKWNDSYIARILDNPSVIGQFQWKTLRYDELTGKKQRQSIGDVLEGFFPRVIQQAQWVKVQKIRTGRAKRPGAIGKNVRNLFTGIAYCGHTGFPMIFANKNPWFYLKSSASKAPKGIRLRPWRYEDFESAFFKFIGDLNTENLVDPQLVPELEVAREELALLQAKVENLRKSIDRLLTLVEEGAEDELPQTKKRLSEKEKSLKEAEAELKTRNEKHERITESSQKAEESLSVLKLLQAKRNDVEFRLRLRDELPNLIEGVIVYLDGRQFYSVRHFTKKENVEKMSVQSWRKFLDWNRDRFMKAGGEIRAFHVLFKTGALRRVTIQTQPGFAPDIHSGEGQSERGRFIREDFRGRIEAEDPEAVQIVTGEETVMGQVFPYAGAKYPLGRKSHEDDKRNVLGKKIKKKMKKK